MQNYMAHCKTETGVNAHSPSPNDDAPVPAVTFVLEGQAYALPLSSVIRVEQAVAVTRVPGSPPQIMGIINHHGVILPVVNLRYRLGLPLRALLPSDQMLVIRLSETKAAVLPVDNVVGISSITVRASDNSSASHSVLSGSENLKICGMLPTEEGTLLLATPESLLQMPQQAPITAPDPAEPLESESSDSWNTCLQELIDQA